MPRLLNDAMVSLSLSNLCFVSSWLVLINPYHYSYYNRKADPGFTEFTALGLDILLLAAVFWVAVTLARRFPQPAVIEMARWSLLAALVIPINSLIRGRDSYTSLFELVRRERWLTIAVVLLAIGLVVILHRYRRQVTRFAAIVLLILSPLVVVNFASGLWLRHKHAPSADAFLDQQPAPKDQGELKPAQVLWIVFDEMDQRLTFPARASTTRLPELDRLRAQAVYAPNSYPPSYTTLVSMPALITGQLLTDATRVRPDDLELTLANKSVVHWSTQPTVFSQARSEGFRTGIAGWFNPYCRILGNSLDRCAWVPFVDEVNPTLDPLTVPQAMMVWARNTFYGVPFVFRIFKNEFETKRKREHIEEHSRLMTSVRECLAADLNLRLLHFAVPHWPWIYDRKRATITSEPGGKYQDNLELVDRTLGELRRSLEDSGKWDDSAVLVTSDHWWRESETVNGRRDHRVPFLLKLPGQKAGLEYSTPFNTIVTRDLLMDLLRGNLKTPQEVAKWLDQHTSVAESPFTQNLP